MTLNIPLRRYAPALRKAADFDSALKLGWLDSNQRMAESKSAALPLGYTPLRYRARLPYRRVRRDPLTLESVVALPCGDQSLRTDIA